MVPNTFVSISHSLFFEYLKFFPKHKIRVITPVNTEEFRKGSADIVAVTGNVTLPDSIREFPAVSYSRRQEAR